MKMNKLGKISFHEIIGWYGVIAILLAYALNSFTVLTAKSAPYQLLNLTGAIGIVLISLRKKAYQPATLNLIWMIIAIIALFKILQ